MQRVRLSSIVEEVSKRLENAGFKPSTTVYQLFGRDGADLQHMGFAIGTPGSTDGSSRRGADRFIQGELVVGITFQIKADDQPGSFLEALDAFEDADNAALSVDRRLGFHLHPVRRIRTLVADEWLRSDLFYTFDHVHWS